MKHLIVGYGYCGYYLAQELLKQKHKIWTLSRSNDQARILENVNHLTADVSNYVPLLDDMNVVHYMIPPPKMGQSKIPPQEKHTPGKTQIKTNAMSKHTKTQDTTEMHYTRHKDEATLQDSRRKK